jgi:Tripartite tricarboxylate transporter TctB family
LSRKKIEVLFSILIVLFLVWALWEARHWPAPSKLFPWSLGFTVLALALLQVALAWRAALNESRAAGMAEPGSDNANASAGAGTSASESSLVPPEIARRRAIIIAGWIVAFFIGIALLGFKLGSLFLTFVFLKFTAKEKWTISAAIAVASYLFFWLVFDLALRAPLGTGLIGDYFGMN